MCHQKKTEGVQVDENALCLAMCCSNMTAQTLYLREDMTEVAACATLTITKCTRQFKNSAKVNVQNYMYSSS